MSVLLMYVSLAVWLITLILSAYSTYHLYEYGSSNINGVWEMLRRKTDVITCIALGVAASTFFSTLNGWLNSWVVIVIAFPLTWLLARIILIFSLAIIARPYTQREKMRHNYTRAFWEAKAQLEKEGLLPPEPKLIGSTQQERDQYSKAIEELRKQGKLPPVPKRMKKNNK